MPFLASFEVFESCHKHELQDPFIDTDNLGHISATPSRYSIEDIIPDLPKGSAY